MKLQQLRYLVHVVRQGLNVSDAAEALHTSQPGISKQIKLLEEELGVDVFVRHGKRVIDVTEPGKTIVAIAERILKEVDNLKQVGREFAAETAGSFTVATTHTQARYALPPVIKRFMGRYPDVRLSLKQGSPMQISQTVIDGEADLVIATEAISHFDELVLLPCYQWNRCIVVPPKHPLLKLERIALEDVASYPLITYDFAFTGRSAMQRAFEQKGLTPNIVLTAIDSDVIKTYVALGLGVGILAQMAFDPKEDPALRSIDASHLFEPSATHIGIRKNTYLRGYAYDFIEMFAPHLTRKAVDTAMKGDGSNYEL
ncbi:MAG: HTH-type transcriptional regulator CysB [Pseudomonadota bacterium]